MYRLEAKDITLYFGILKFSELNIVTKRAVSKVFVHEQAHYPPFNNDIALLKFNEALKFTDTIRPVKLPNPNTNFEGHMVTAVGWGVTETTDKMSEELRYTELRVINDEECKNRSKESDSSLEITEGIICAFTHDEKPRSPCFGDSGGPLVFQGDTLVGIVSFGNYCGKEIHFYVRVSHYINWIDDKMRLSVSDNVLVHSN